MPQYLLSVWFDEPYDDPDLSAPETDARRSAREVSSPVPNDARAAGFLVAADARELRSAAMKSEIGK